MSSENVRERKEKRRLTFVVIPGSDSTKTRSFSVARWGFIVASISVVLVIVALVTALIVYTPVGSRLPISHPELERQYGRQIAEIQDQLSTVLRQLSVLRLYNLKLRKAMGEGISKGDSTFAEAAGSDTTLRPSWNPERRSHVTAEPVERAAPPVSSTTELVGSAFRTMDRGAGGRQYRLDLPLTMPADGYLTREFSTDRLHYGVDIAGKSGSPVLAAADGTVLFAGWTNDGGFMLILAHDEGYVTVYKHNQSLLVNVGTPVRRGEMIGLLGSTGETSSGPHLHFEVWKNGVALNPSEYLLIIQ